MNLKTISKPVALFAIVAFILLVFPVVALTVFDGSGVSGTGTVNSTSAPVETAQVAAVQENVISGDFDSVDWKSCLLYTSPSPRDQRGSRMPSSA